MSKISSNMVYSRVVPNKHVRSIFTQFGVKSQSLFLECALNYRRMSYNFTYSFSAWHDAIEISASSATVMYPVIQGRHNAILIYIRFVYEHNYNKHNSREEVQRAKRLASELSTATRSTYLTPSLTIILAYSLEDRAESSII